MPPDNFQKQFGHKGKVIRHDADDVWVELLAANDFGFAEPDVVSFRAAEIQRLRSLGPNHCILTEKESGWIIALPHAVLAEMIYAPEGNVVDLKPHSYLGDKGKLVKSIKADFEEAALLKKYEDFSRLTYQAYVRAPQDNNFTEFTFKGSDIYFSKLSDGGSKMGGECLTFIMRQANGTPFGGDTFILEATMKEFAQKVKAVKESGGDTLDLRAYSLRKGKTFKEDRPSP